MRPLSQDVSSLPLRSSGKSHHILISSLYNGKIYLKENLETHVLHLFAIKYNEAVELSLSNLMCLLHYAAAKRFEEANCPNAESLANTLVC